MSGGTGVNPYTEYCWERLPCGLCQRTNAPCPYAGNQQTEITCAGNRLTYANGTWAPGGSLISEDMTADDT